MPDEFAQGDYPTAWSDFIGQSKAKQQIQLAARSAKARRTRMDHTLLASGTPGIGKTSLALLAARTMGTNMVATSGVVSAHAARIHFANMRDGDILLIDEAHRLVESGKKHAEWLLHYLQDGMLIGPFRPEEVPAVTIIAATTEAGKLPTTITSRFTVRPTLVEYTDEEAAGVTAKLAKRVLVDLPQPTKANCLAIAIAGNRNPRAIRQILSTLRDMAITGMMTDGYDIGVLLDWCGITPDGLNEQAQTYLNVLYRDFGGKAGQRALEDRLQEPGGLGDIERVLISKQFISKTATGRVITMAGTRRAMALSA